MARKKQTPEQKEVAEAKERLAEIAEQLPFVAENSVQERLQAEQFHLTRRVHDIESFVPDPEPDEDS